MLAGAAESLSRHSGSTDRRCVVGMRFVDVSRGSDPHSPIPDPSTSRGEGRDVNGGCG